MTPPMEVALTRDGAFGRPTRRRRSFFRGGVRFIRVAGCRFIATSGGTSVFESRSRNEFCVRRDPSIPPYLACARCHKIGATLAHSHDSLRAPTRQTVGGDVVWRDAALAAPAKSPEYCNVAHNSCVGFSIFSTNLSAPRNSVAVQPRGLKG